MTYEIRHLIDGKYKESWVMESSTEHEQSIKTDKIIKIFSKGKRSKFIVNTLQKGTK